MHSGEDPKDGLRYPATALIDRAVALGFDAIAITLHEKVIEDERVYAYAAERGLLMIPAAEARIGGRDVLVYNVTQQDVNGLKTMADLRAFKRARGRETLVVAPHPCYPVGHSLGKMFEPNMDLFDAVEYAAMHLSWLNPNRPAMRLAMRHKKPVIATSDAHALWMFGSHYTRVDAERSWPAIFDAIRAGRVETVSPSVSVGTVLRFVVLDGLFVRRHGEMVVSFEERPVMVRAL